MQKKHCRYILKNKNSLKFPIFFFAQYLLSKIFFPMRILGTYIFKSAKLLIRTLYKGFAFLNFQTISINFTRKKYRPCLRFVCSVGDELVRHLSIMDNLDQKRNCEFCQRRISTKKLSDRSIFQTGR